MKFEQLIESIELTQNSLQQKALSTVNQLATIRNWLIGYYIVEFEQKGEERAKYGNKLLQTLSNELHKKKLKGFSVTNLRLFRQFYSVYPQIHQALPDVLSLEIHQPLADQLKIGNIQPMAEQLELQISQPPADQSDKTVQVSGGKLLQHFSFRHFTKRQQRYIFVIFYNANNFPIIFHIFEKENDYKCFPL
ncbi:MAG: DUF1016 domain-containing protein [Cytophagales bacterium]|nr:DUF1016 domain-containing protein [Cytophagales bacterium]